MSEERCQEVFNFVVQEEGSTFEDDPRDPGGATKFGVTLQVLREYRHDFSLSPDDVASLTFGDALQVFRDLYWVPCRADVLPIGIDASVVDEAYNAGVSRAIKFLQQAANVPVDGVFGPQTLNAVQAVDPTTIVQTFGNICSEFYRSLDNPTFQKGWLNRVAAREAFSIASIQNNTATA